MSPGTTDGIRPVREDDIAAMTRIYNCYVTGSTATFETEPVAEDEMARRMAGVVADGGPCLVCERCGEVVGYCYAHPWKERAAYAHTFETTVYVAAAHTGRGTGRMLMAALVDACRERGVHALVACITSDNESSLRLHESLGFRRVSLFDEVGRKFGRWLGVIDCELLLG